MEFWTNELSDSAKQDVFIFRDNKNYDGVDHQYINPPKPLARTNNFVDGGAQTFTRPPLQYQSNDTNLYNCLDNAVNSKNGPKFSMADVFKNNKFITPKRPLDDWDVLHKTNPIVPSNSKTPSTKP